MDEITKIEAEIMNIKKSMKARQDGTFLNTAMESAANKAHSETVNLDANLWIPPKSNIPERGKEEKVNREDLSKSSSDQQKENNNESDQT